MQKLLALALATCSAASAQTPAVNRMPDGSRDLYIGLGAVSAPRYDGARQRRVDALPVLQLELSNGIFISGMSAGMHLSASPRIEYGPLLALQPRRSQAGTATGIGGVESTFAPPSVLPPPSAERAGSALAGMDTIGTRLQAGGFLNLYLSPSLRLTNNLLYGSGNAKKGAVWDIGLQRIAAEPALQHAVSLTAGLTLGNREYNQAFFGVSPAEAQRSGNRAYQAAGGVKDVYLGARWNWALAPAWMISSALKGQRLVGCAKDSPLVQRPANFTVSTALAYRF